MLAKRIIPTLLVHGRALVKGQRFDSWRSIGHAAQCARVHAMRGVDELMILDITATAEHRGPDLDVVRDLAATCFMPITVGGGVRTLKDVGALLRAGADKVAVCTAAFDDPSFVRRASQRYGRQAIVVVVEHDSQTLTSNNGRVRHVEHPADWARCNTLRGAGEIVLSAVARDGCMQGYDLEMIRRISPEMDVPLVVSGGCGEYRHMIEAFEAGADGCAAGAMFSFTDATPRGAAQAIQSAGMEARLCG